VPIVIKKLRTMALLVVPAVLWLAEPAGASILNMG